MAKQYGIAKLGDSSVGHGSLPGKIASAGAFGRIILSAKGRKRLFKNDQREELTPCCFVLLRRELPWLRTAADDPSAPSSSEEKVVECEFQWLVDHERLQGDSKPLTNRTHICPCASNDRWYPALRQRRLEKEVAARFQVAEFRRRLKGEFTSAGSSTWNRSTSCPLAVRRARLVSSVSIGAASR
jgi:hypothetical protein